MCTVERGGCARYPAHRARVLGHSVYFAVKWRPARDSLIRRITSLMARFNSLLARNKFPVPMRRELRCKPLSLMLDCEPVSALGGPDEQNSRYYVASATLGGACYIIPKIPCIFPANREFGLQRRVRS